MSIVTQPTVIDNPVAAGVDTHADVHVAALIDRVGRELGHASFPTTRAGYRDLRAWIDSHGTVIVVGVEGTGVYGAGLCRYLTDGGVHIVEVDRPDRKARRFAGKSDPIDAYAAARAALSGRASGTPKTRDGNVEMIRVLRVARTSAVKARAVAITQLKAVIKTAPDDLRSELRDLDGATLITRCAGLHSARGPAPTPSPFAKRAPRPGRLDPAASTTSPPPRNELWPTLRVAFTSSAMTSTTSTTISTRSSQRPRPRSWRCSVLAPMSPANSSRPSATTPTDSAARPRSRISAAPHRSRRHRAKRIATASTVAATATPTARPTESR